MARDDWPRCYASPPCMAGEIAPDYFGLTPVDPEQARDVARWRAAERTRLLNERNAMSVAARGKASAAVAEHLCTLFSDRFGDARGRVLSAYWPIKGEPDLRRLMTDLHVSGVTVALPVVEAKAAPLVFRRWTPETRMMRGVWNIFVPPVEAEVLTPELMLVPVTGWDGGGYRLGNGGGYFDRTLAAIKPHPVTIGIGFQGARLDTIYPQPRDIPLDFILTEEGVQVMRRPE